MENRWYQIYTKPNTETKLYNKICAYGFQAFLPVRIIKRQWSDRVKTIKVPAFKSYVFAKLNYNEMRFVERLKQFCFYVTYVGSINASDQKYDKRFPCITDTTVEQIQRILTEYPQAIWVDKTLIKGNEIEITEGSLKRYKGILIEQPAGKKVAIKLHGLNHSLVITVPTEFLKKIA